MTLTFNNQDGVVESDIPFEVVAAVDINTTANQIYQHNFPGTKLINKLIESMSVAQLNRLQCNMLLMSPPCQPFCRVGKQQDMQDERTKSFLYILDVLPELDNPPDYILVENVKGFDTSESCKRLLHTLNSLSYEVQEFLLSPLQFGIPNSRLRYYLVAKRKPLKFHFDTSAGTLTQNLQGGFHLHLYTDVNFSDIKNREISTEIPQCCEQFLIHRSLNTRNMAESPVNSGNTNSEQQTLSTKLERSIPVESTLTSAEHLDKRVNMIGATANLNSDSTSVSQSGDGLHKKDIVDNESELPLFQKFKSTCKCIGEFLETDACIEEYLVPEKFFRRFWVMDIVTAQDKNSCCFTRRYAHHIEGSGSIIQMSTEHEHDLSYYKRQRIYDDTVHEAVRQRKLRFFSHREIANLMCFPKELRFPEEMTNIQCYRVLGNSLNVHVVSVLIRLLVAGDSD